MVLGYIILSSTTIQFNNVNHEIQQIAVHFMEIFAAAAYIMHEQNL